MVSAVRREPVKSGATAPTMIPKRNTVPVALDSADRTRVVSVGGWATPALLRTPSIVAIAATSKTINPTMTSIRSPLICEYTTSTRSIRDAVNIVDVLR